MITCRALDVLEFNPGDMGQFFLLHSHLKLNLIQLLNFEINKPGYTLEEKPKLHGSTPSALVPASLLGWFHSLCSALLHISHGSSKFHISGVSGGIKLHFHIFMK